jgi:hypothetical protein
MNLRVDRERPLSRSAAYMPMYSFPVLGVYICPGIEATNRESHRMYGDHFSHPADPE